MSQEMFEENEAAIRSAVKALMGDTKRRKKFRLLRVRETYTKEYLAEVFHIPNYGPVIAHYPHGDPDRLRTTVAYAAQRRGKREPGEPVIQPLTDNPGQRFPISARSFQFRLPVQNFRQWIAEGKTEHFLSGRVS